MPDTQAMPDISKTSTSLGDIRPTGVEGLDILLQGGLPSDSTILLAGEPGTGKTILCMQWLFSGYEKYNEPGIYITLTEPVNKAIRNAERMTFVKKENITPGKVHIEDLRNIMHSLDLDEKQLTLADIDKIIDALGDLLMQCKAKRIVIDSISAIAYRLQDKDLIRNFVYHLDALLTPMNVTVIMTSEVLGEGYSMNGVEEFISDGIIKMSRKLYKEEVVRMLQIVKMRGIDYDAQPTNYRIALEGIKLFPKLKPQLSYHVSENRLSTGISGLDSMTKGGYFEGSSILISGSSGTGKTLISGHFILEGLKKNEKSLYISFEESQDQIFRNARAFGWNFESYMSKDLLHIISVEPEQLYIEEHIAAILKEISEHNPKRVVIDSLSALGNRFSPDILHDFLSRINAYLKDKMITTIFTNATATFIGATEVSDAHLSTVIDQIVMLRYVEIQSELKHAVLILKMRGSSHDKKLREIVFTDHGIEVTSDFSGLEGVLSGSTHKVSDSIEEQLHALFLEILGPMGEKIFIQEKGKGLSEESVAKMLGELESQGIVSKRRKEGFISSTSYIFNGRSAVNKGITNVSEKDEPKGIAKLFHF